MGPMGGYPPGALIPLKYKIPTRESSGAVAVEEQQGQGPRQPQQQNDHQRQVVMRRFHFAFQLDLGLIIKLAAVVFLFSQEGSKQKFILLVFFASLVYLYQTGALAPLLRWIRRGVALPPPQPPVRLDNRIPPEHDNRNDVPPEENHEAENQNQNQNPIPNENQNQNTGDEEPPAANENRPEPERRNGLNWWGIVREVQTFVVGFVTSLLPGFQHND
uniref:Uncharacterized protein n=1 Tax=Ananas comosus var. bracteatus TaxID=296719 RepID=A0A6V7NX79_ANACO|nr:unnamed protein product [Ananas comosus var. bracteatus]